MRQLPAWFDNYNNTHPRKALKTRSPREFREAQANLQKAWCTPTLVGPWLLGCDERQCDG